MRPPARARWENPRCFALALPCLALLAFFFARRCWIEQCSSPLRKWHAPKPHWMTTGLSEQRLRIVIIRGAHNNQINHKVLVDAPVLIARRRIEQRGSA